MKRANLSGLGKSVLLLGLFAVGAAGAHGADAPQPEPSAGAGTGASAQTHPMSSDQLDKSLAEFRAAAERLERAVNRTARENTEDISRKFDERASSVLSDISKSLNQAAGKLEKRSKKKTPPAKSSAPAEPGN